METAKNLLILFSPYLFWAAIYIFAAVRPSRKERKFKESQKRYIRYGDEILKIK